MASDEQEPQRIRVLLVAEDPLARSGLAAMLEGGDDLIVLAPADPEQAAGAFRLYRPQASVWDLGLAPGAPPDELRALADADAPVIALAADETAAATALAAGARGVLSREAPAARIAAAVRATLGGLLVVDAAVAGALLRPPPEAEGLPDALTPRETEVLQLLAQGLSNRAVADRLAISEHTAKFHVNAILGKLGARGRTDAVVKAARLGLIVL